MSEPSKLYRQLLRLYPARFREEYAIPLELQFQDDYRGARSRLALLAFWTHVLGDLAISIPVEIMREVAQDVRTSARIYRRRPMATGLAVIALAMAIGVTTGVFSVLNGVLFRSLPFREPERLVQIWMFHFREQGEVKDWGNRSGYLDGAAEISTVEMNLNRGAEASRVTVTEVSSNFFQVLGIEPELGRAFAPDEDARGANGVTVIGHGLWRDLSGGDRGVLGSTVSVNGVPLTVIGVAPRGFDYPDRTGLWSAGRNKLPQGYGARDSGIVGRLKPGNTHGAGEGDVHGRASKSVSSEEPRALDAYGPVHASPGSTRGIREPGLHRAVCGGSACALYCLRQRRATAAFPEQRARLQELQKSVSLLTIACSPRTS